MTNIAANGSNLQRKHYRAANEVDRVQFKLTSYDMTLDFSFVLVLEQIMHQNENYSTCGGRGQVMRTEQTPFGMFSQGPPGDLYVYLDIEERYTRDSKRCHEPEFFYIRRLSGCAILGTVMKRFWRVVVVAAADYYSTLGVPKSASSKEIKAAIRKLARQFHPDVNKEPGATDKFRDISTSFENSNPYSYGKTILEIHQ
ncbi:hypothetical protein CASFOL_014653 [Castilleja foliolosa]|uniref:J domain-containing protein n=1 Tax=Castilleja foliolosa TaxID=1961234 RepID=A0ABD3DFS1_9LAMI